MMTHDWVGDVTLDFIGNKNRIEHNIGMFLVAQKHGPGTASLIGNLNEARGLIINDRRNGNMWNAILGRGGTAFEWSDLKHNSEGLSRWSSYTYWDRIMSHPKANTSITPKAKKPTYIHK